MQDAVDEVQAAYPERVITLSAQRPQRQWDRDRLQQAIVNLVANAVEHSPAQARLTVRMRSDRDAVVEVHRGAAHRARLHARIFDARGRVELQVGQRAGEKGAV